MSTFLARLGHLNTRRTAELLWKSGKRKRVGWGSRADQYRSYGDDDGVRWTAGGLSFSDDVKGSERKRTEKSGEEKGKGVDYAPFREQELKADAFFNQRSPESATWEEEGESRAVDEEVDEEQQRENLWEQFEHMEDEEEDMQLESSDDHKQNDPRVPFERIEDGEEDIDSELRNEGGPLYTPFQEHELAEDPSSAQEQYEQTEEGEEIIDVESSDDMDIPTAKGAHDDAMDRFMKSTSMLEVDYKYHFPIALLKREADMLTRCLFSAQRVNDVDFLRSIDQATFSEVIDILQPSNFVIHLASAYLEFSSTVARILGVAPMYQVAYDYSIVLRKIVQVRRSTGIKLTPDDYIVLLRAARDLGSRDMGVEIWLKMLDDGHAPTTTSYNLFMATVVFHGVHRSGGRHRVRVTPFNMSNREKPWRNPRFRNYRIARGGMREHVMRMFNEMLRNGVVADEESFRILLMACGREGDMTTVKAVMKKVWGIDVDGIIEGKDEAEMLPKQIPETSRIRPTPNLLYTIAHVFGINNDVPGALRVIDFVARHFQIEMSDSGWSELFEWTFVLSRNRSGNAARDGQNPGQLPPPSLTALWETMTGPPYLIQPSMAMYNIMIKNLSRRHHTAQIIEKMHEGLRLHRRHVSNAGLAQKRLVETLKLQRQGLEMEASVEALRNDYEYAHLIRLRDRFWLARWLRLLVASYKFVKSRHMIDDPLVGELPFILWEWRYYAKRTVKYEMSTGFVEIHMRTMEEEGANRRVKVAKREKTAAALDLEGDARKLVGNDWIHGWNPAPRRGPTDLEGREMREARSVERRRMRQGRGRGMGVL